MPSRSHLYFGRAGHLVAMSEFLLREWKVAIPEVDVGDDIFVVDDGQSTLRRVQVKTSTAIRRTYGWSAQFQIARIHLKNAIEGSFTHFLFLARFDDHWAAPIIIRSDYLLDHASNDHIGGNHGEVINLYFAYSDAGVKCSNVDFSKYMNDYTDFPTLSS